MKSANIEQNSQKSFQTRVDRDALKELKLLAVEKDVDIQDIVSDAIREGVRVIRKRESLPA